MEFSWLILIALSVALVPTLEACPDDCFQVEGLFAEVMTPMNDDGDVAYDVIGQYAQFLNDKRVNGVVVASAKGEGPSLNETQNKRLLDAWMEAAKPLNLLVISSVGAVPMPFTLEMARYSEEIGVDCIFAMPDVFYKPTTPAELVYNINLISKAAPDTPLVYEDIPNYTGVDVDMEEFFELAQDQICTFRGVKSNVFQNLLLLQNKVTDPYKLYASNDLRPTPYYLAAEVFLGFTNFVLAELNFFPEDIINIVNSGQNGYYRQDIPLYQVLSDVIDVILENGNEIAALKAAMPMITGIDVGEPLPPIVPLTLNEIEELEEGLRENNIRIVKSDTGYCSC